MSQTTFINYRPLISKASIVDLGRFMKKYCNVVLWETCFLVLMFLTIPILILVYCETIGEVCFFMGLIGLPGLLFMALDDLWSSKKRRSSGTSKFIKIMMYFDSHPAAYAFVSAAAFLPSIDEQCTCGDVEDYARAVFDLCEVKMRRS